MRRITPRSIKEVFSRHELAGPLIAAITLFAASASISPYFLTFQNQRVVLLMLTPYVLLALGESIIILMGSIDLSPGSVMGLTAVVIGYFMVFMNMPLSLAVVLGLGIGALIGAINGILITKAKLPSFVVTLATLLAGRGMSYILTAGYSISGPRLTALGILLYEVFSIPIMIWILIPIILLYYLLLRRTSFGALIYAIGGNEEAVRLMGLNADNIKIIAFTLAGFFYALSGLVVLAQLRSAWSYIGYGYELTAIASCVLGGISLAGGMGSPLSPIIGAYILTLISNILILLGVNPYYQWVVTGIVLTIAGAALTRGIRYAK